jgi:hypothetical protein
MYNTLTVLGVDYAPIFKYLVLILLDIVLLFLVARVEI